MGIQGRVQHQVRFALAAVICATAALLAGPPVASALPRPALRGPGIAMPSHHSSASPALHPLIANCNGAIPPPSLTMCNLTYHNGPVMVTNRTHVVLWAPTGFSYPTGYVNLIERYLTDVAHDSGQARNTYSVDTQYNQTTPTTQNIAYDSTYAGELDDSDVYPAADAACTALEGSATTCLTETQEIDELDTFINSKSGPRTAADLYLLVMPPKVQTCFDGETDCGPYGAGKPDSMGNTSEYCAYHNSFTSGLGSKPVTLWANIVYDPGAGNGCSNSEPNGNGADETINVLSHEHNEAITDPQPSSGWLDDNTDNGGEIGDQCNFDLGPTIGSTASGNFDELVNGNPYSVQMMWSNAITGCAMNFGATAPTAAFTFLPPAPKTLQSVAFDGSASKSNDTGGSIVKYTWDFGDGSGFGSGATPTHTYAASGTFTVKLTVEDDAGQTATTMHDVTVTALPTQTTYTGATSGDFGTSTTLSAHLVDTTNSVDIQGRTITFTLGTQSCSTGPTNASGDASCSITLAQTPGNYTVKASFAGDSVYAASDSGSQPFTINKAPTTTTVVSNHPTSVFGQPVTFTATVSPNDGGGTVAFKADGTVIAGCATQSLTGPSPFQATCTTAALSVSGSPHAISAVYTGDTDYLGSTSATITQTVNKDPTTTTVTAAPASPATFGTSVTFTAAVTANPPGAGTPTGSVAFKVDGTPVGTVGLTGGHASIATASLSAGSHSISATYGGDGNFFGSAGSLPYTVTCTTTITGTHSGTLEVTGSTCLTSGAVLNGSVVLHGGGALDLEGARVTGAIDATATSGVIRVCRSSVGGSVDIKSATGLVIVGDPGDASCAPNTISGTLLLQNDTGGVEAIDNTVTGAILTTGDSGPGPFPGDVTTISGNHH
ncbi:MAG TPA: Ig-like domain repeat protein [Solirubrobacteraceae bacterium]